MGLVANGGILLNGRIHSPREVLKRCISLFNILTPRRVMHKSVKITLNDALLRHYYHQRSHKDHSAIKKKHFTPPKTQITPI